MKKLLLLLVLLFMFGSGLHAQQPLNFAPVGAEWYYNRSADYPPYFLHSFTRFQCIGTTNINGKECHIIEKYFKYDCWHVVDSSSIYYLYIDSLQVYEVENQNMYLLYDFSKTVGEYWVMPKYNDTIFVENIEDFVLTNGDTCKIFTVENVLQEDYYYSEITNRFGGIEGLYPRLFMTGCERGGIRCYMEDSTIVYKNWNNNCDSSSISGLSELIIPDIKIPNPVSDNITILTNDNQIPIKYIEIYSMTGQFILSLPQPSGDNITIPFSQYHNGMYIMKILLQDQSCKTYKIIKL